MIRRYDVRLPAEDFAADRHRRVLATLPKHFRIIDSGPADAELITRGAPSEARISVLDSPGDVRLVAPARGRQVVPALRLVPRLDEDARLKTSTGFTLIDVTAAITGRDRTSQANVLVEAAAAYRMLTERRVESLDLHRFRGGFAATLGAMHGPILTLACVECFAASDSWRLWAVGTSSRLSLEIEDGGTARPANITHFDRTGTRQPTPIYQSAERRAWLEVHALLDDSVRRPAYGWAEFNEDRTLIDRVMQREKSPVAALA